MKHSRQTTYRIESLRGIRPNRNRRNLQNEKTRLLPKQSRSTQRGFTIVELLIVIVIIAILAAITIVAYNGIQNRVYDSAVTSDLNSIAKKFALYKIDSTAGTYPATALSPTLGDFQMSISKSAYRLDGNQFNLLNCMVSSGAGYLMVAQSKSGKFFMVGSANTSPREVTASITLGDASSCSTLAPGSTAYGAGYSTTSGGWRPWTNG